jgi:hypothetical protein
MSAHDLPGVEAAGLAAVADEGVAGRLRWRFNRLRCMSAGEVLHRVGRTVLAGMERVRLLPASPVPEPDLSAARPQPWIQARPAIDAAPYLRAADRLCAGHMSLFALADVFVGRPPRWNRDPKTGIEAPLRYGKTLDYRDPVQVGDIKYLWEMNRHGHLVRLAQAWRLSGDERYSGTLARHLESWFDACPYPMGANWSSALEAALRLINWAAAWQILGGAESGVFADAAGRCLRRRWLRSVYQHAQFVHGWFSFYSSANNHLLGEAAGLFIASQTWPYWERAEVWRHRAKSLLEREAMRQNGADGVNLEQATSYQQFVLDLLILALLAGKANGHWFGVGYESRIEAMLEFLASIMDARGNVPAIGDADDARALDLGADGCPIYRSLLATGAVLFRRDEFAFKAGGVDDRTRWLLGAQADERVEPEGPVRSRLPVRRAFPEGGYYILGSDFESDEEIRVVADAGPLGYQSIAAHGHADALSFTLSVGGVEFLVDAGTYAYHTEGSWRAYFRGTGAHNTVRVDGRDQSRQGGISCGCARRGPAAASGAATAPRTRSRAGRTATRTSTIR